MTNAPIFDVSPLGSVQSNMNVSIWSTVMSSYENKDYKQAMFHLLDYIDSSIPEKYGDDTKQKFTIPHGSVILNVEITDDEFIVNTPFVKLPEGGSVALLRQVAQLNFHPIGLANIVLDQEEQLTFQYRCPLELCEPYKIYYVLREICVNADRYDDLFITKFKAIQIREPKIERHSEDVLNNAWDTIQGYVSEAQEYISYFESKRWERFIFDTLHLAFLKIDYFIAPQGYLRTELEDSIADLVSNRPFNERIHKAKTFLQKLKDYNKETFLQDIYIAEVFIPFKYNSDLAAIRKNLQYGYDTAKGEMSNSNYMATTLTLLQEFYRLFYYNYVDNEMANSVLNALKESSNKPWEQAAPILWDCINSIMVEQNTNEYSNARSER